MCSSKSFAFLESIWFLCLFLRSTEAQTAAAHQSIFTLDAFSFQQSCVQDCFTTGYANIDCYTDMLGSALGCPNSPCSKTWAAVDDCYCRGDLQLAGHDWLSSCIAELCTVGDNSVNLENAVSIYSSYCTDRGFTALPVQNIAETSTKKTNSASTATTANSQPGETSSSSSDSSQTTSTASSSTNKTLTIALGVACALFVIISIVAGFLFWKIRRDKKKLWLGLLKGDSEVHQDESASQVNQPSVMIGPTYPHYAVPPSALSSNRAYQSTIGPGPYFPPRH
ncbi:uncharacterized protein A1O9_02143 [Exophiala aquamarina CBS 119918]|uniref:Extracellular membrane protein CFEM domain-containing protein n=1 Tax=Exophiala aquamarina CBS 119918 TaxID=1182545 RepID=A0A072PLE6_9EURO|nr:uncharacterized protein A1O9_02143 [Exophiala aquamarina CBS 119918]KEF60582.1 hypothetical protein A1O9_02143 [Exophiala aquamarina CBS 119918]